MNTAESVTRVDSAKSQSGYTLLEVMIAMTILGVGLMSIAVAQVSALRIASKSKNMQQAMFLAREAMDDIDARLPTDPFLKNNAVIPDVNNPIKVGNDPDDGTTFTRQTTVTPDDPELGMSRVVVAVTWVNASGPGNNVITLTATKRRQ